MRRIECAFHCMSYLSGRYWFGGSGRVLDGFWSGGVMVSGVLTERQQGAMGEGKARFELGRFIIS